MSRSDQWIGLTKKGNDWMEARIKEGYKFNLTKKPIGFYAWIQPDEIFGREVIINNVTYREHIQAEPWSSGPMYFTNFEIIKNGKVIGTMFDWEEDETVKGEVDYDNGKFYV